MTMYIEHVLLKITRCIVVRILYSIIHKHILDMLDCICKMRQNGDALPSYNILHTLYPKTDIDLK